MRRILFMLVLTLAWRTTSPGLAGTWYVDGYSSGSGDGKSPEAAFNTIQRGMDAAYHGDTIVVGQGTYFENIQFKGKNITVTSSDPLDSEVVANTIIDGSGAGSVVVFDGSEDDQCVLSGFTIRNGRAKYGGGICGGTAENHTRAVIRYNVINKNSAISSSGNEYCGGGMVYCDGLVERNTITGNRADYGGGLGWCNGPVQHNTISGNSVTRGGGLFHCDGRVRNNVLSNNSATVSGGALCGCAGIIESNTIAANSAPAGGGLFGCDGTIRNNLITGNIASSGGGVSWCNGIIRNNTITRNSAHREGGGITQCSGTIGNCIIWGNTAPDGAQVFSGADPEYCCIESWMESGLGNTTEDPRFRYNSYFLTDESPCIDAGYNVNWMWDAVDLAGNPRILPRTSYWRVDMGAFEYVSPDLRPLMITRTGGGEVWVIRIGLPGERCIFRWTWDLINEPWQEKLNVSATSRLTIFKDLYPSGGQRFYQLEIR